MTNEDILRQAIYWWLLHPARTMDETHLADFAIKIRDEALAARDAEVKAARDVIRHYADKEHWRPSAAVTDDMDDRDYERLYKDLYIIDLHGYDHAAEFFVKWPEKEARDEQK